MGAATTVLRSVGRHAGPHLLEATLGPTACFLTGRALWGVDGALALAIGWTGACIARRALRGRHVGGLLVIAMTTLVLRSAVALALHSERAYLVAPPIVTIVMGLAFMASALSKRPLLGRVVADLVPAAWVDIDDPRTARLCRIGSVVWGAEQIIASTVSLAMIATMSVTTYVVVNSLVSWSIFAAVIGVTVPLFRCELRSLWAAHHVAQPAQIAAEF